jgi:hypothetical protein
MLPRLSGDDDEAAIIVCWCGGGHCPVADGGTEIN